MDLASESVIFVLTCKLDSLESFQDHMDSFCGFGKHGLDWNSDSDMACVLEVFVVVSTFLELLDNLAVVWELANCLFD